MENTNELVEKIIKEALGDYLSEYTIKEVLKEVISDFVRDKFKNYFEHNTNQYINNLLDEEVMKYLKEPTIVTDGWAYEKRYNSFEEFFRAKCHEAIADKSDVKRIIENQVKDQINKMFREKIGEITPKVQELIVNEMMNPSK